MSELLFCRPFRNSQRLQTAWSMDILALCGSPC